MKRSLHMRLIVLFSAVAIAPLWSIAANAQPQQYPTKPVRILVFGPPGGLADQLARMLSMTLPEQFRQPVIVENKPGGAASPAVNELKATGQDGHTVLLGLGSLVTELPHAFKVHYAPFSDLKPVVEVARGGLMLVGNPSLPHTGLRELITYAKTHPGEVSYASYSPGTISHVMGLQLNTAASIELRHIGYKGSPPALQDVMAGHVPLAFDMIANVHNYIKAGKLKPYAVSLSKRTPMFPDVPTFSELGYSQLEHLASFLVYTHPQTPEHVQLKIREAVMLTLQQQSFKQRLSALNMEPGRGQSTGDITASLRLDYDRMGSTLRAVNYRPE